MNYKNSEEKTGASEILSAEDEKIRALLGSLKRAEAPKDFDFRVKRRITNEKSNDYRSTFPPVLRYVLPLGLIILVAVAVVFNSLYFGDARNIVPEIAEGKVQKENSLNQTISIRTQIDKNTAELKTTADLPIETVSGSSNIQKKVEKISSPEFKSNIAKSVGKRSGKFSLAENNINIFAGSRDNASTSPRKIINPLGISPDKAVQNFPNAENIRTLTAKEILRQLGVEAVFSNDVWTVKSVRQNSPAERAGVKKGDAVESIDGEKLTDKPLKSGTFEGKKITVLRGAEKVEISLVNKIS